MTEIESKKNVLSSEIRCHKCNKKTNMQCNRCKTPICAKHSYSTHHHFYCADCFLRERNIGILKAWGALVGLLAFVTIIVLVLR